MGISPYSLEQRFEFIKDCYKSGLSIRDRFKFCVNVKN